MVNRSLLLACLLAAPALAGAASDPELLYERGAYRRAGAAAEQRLAADPNDAIALTVLARLRADQGRSAEGIAFGERAVKAAPQSAAAHYALAEAHGQSARSGGPLKGLGAARAFKREAEATLALDPKHADALLALMEFHRLAPGIVGGDRKQRDEFAARLAEVAPERALAQQALDALRARDSAKAERCWRQAVAAAPASARAKLALAQWLAGTDRDPRAAEALAAEVAAAEPWRAGAWQLLAGLQTHGRRWGDLDATLARAETALEGRREAAYAAARQLVSEGVEPARAERWLRQYLEREPEPGSPSHAAARWRLGLALEQQGRRAEALAELQAATRLDPKFEPAKKDLRRLKG